jgi:hypothetical protein
MCKRQLIDQIRELNTTAQPQFLSRFEEAALKEYLEHLRAAQLRRVRIGGWVKRQEKIRLAS